MDLGATSHRSLRELHSLIAEATRTMESGAIITYTARNPDASTPRWPGKPLDKHPDEHHRPWRIHVELLRVLGFEMLTPEPVTGTDEVRIRARKQEVGASGPVTLPPEDIEGRYGSASDYRDFDRLEEPEVLDDYLYSARRLALQPGETLVALGVNDGRELEVFASVPGAHVIGIDQSESAIARARQRLDGGTFHVGDIGRLDDYLAKPADVVIALNVLQCRTLDRDTVLTAMTHWSHEGSRFLITVPNCHRSPHDIHRRPQRRQDRRHDRSLVFKDARHYARTLYRSGRRSIEIFGTYDVFVLAVPEVSSDAPR